jgi:hypothetical protein
MVTHGFRNQTIAPAKNHNCNARLGPVWVDAVEKVLVDIGES